MGIANPSVIQHATEQGQELNVDNFVIGMKPWVDGESPDGIIPTPYTPTPDPAAPQAPGTTTPDTSSQTPSTPAPAPSTPAPSGGSYFPGIDDSQLPDDVLKIKVATLSSSRAVTNVPPAYSWGIILEFANATQADYDTLLAHYTAKASSSDDSLTNGHRIYFDWGVIELSGANLATEKTIRVGVYITSPPATPITPSGPTGR